MKQVSLKIKNYAGNIAVIHDVHLRNKMFRFLMFAFGFLCIVYVVLLANMVFNIVERRTFETQAKILSNEVSSLELNYLALSGKVDLVASHALGFKETKTIFATKKSIGFNNNVDPFSNIKIAKNEI